MGDFLKIDSLKPSYTELERMLKLAAKLVDGGTETITLVPHIQTRGKRKRCLGWFSKEKWSTRDGKLRAEVTLSAETLGRDPVDIAATIVHEAVHVWNAARGITDCATNNRHNGKFKEAAEEIGLICADPTDSIGYGYTTPTDALVNTIIEVFKPDVKKFNLFRLEATPKKAKATKTRAYVCECDVKVRVANGTELDATCHVCDSKFELV